MSRGLGRIQKALLESLERRTTATTFALAGDAFGIVPDPHGVRLLDEKHLVATRRALAKLAKQGLVFEMWRDHKKQRGRKLWCNQRHGLYRALLEKKIQIGNDSPFNGRRYTPAEIEKFKAIKNELIFHAKRLGHWPYILSQWRAMHKDSE